MKPIGPYVFLTTCFIQIYLITLTFFFSVFPPSLLPLTHQQAHNFYEFYSLLLLAFLFNMYFPMFYFSIPSKRIHHLVQMFSWSYTNSLQSIYKNSLEHCWVGHTYINRDTYIFFVDQYDYLVLTGPPEINF